MNATATERQSRLAAALRENLKRRKRQTRERVREAASQDAPPRDDLETAPARPPERPQDLKGSD